MLGGNGYLREFPAERMMRDAKVLQIYEGANEIQKLVTARPMLKQASSRDPIRPEAMPGEGGAAVTRESAPGPDEQETATRERAGAVA